IARFLKTPAIREHCHGMCQTQLGIIVGPLHGEGDQPALVRPLEEAGMPDKRTLLNPDNKFRINALHGLLVLGSWDSLWHRDDGRKTRPLQNACANPMFAPV